MIGCAEKRWQLHSSESTAYIMWTLYTETRFKKRSDKTALKKKERMSATTAASGVLEHGAEKL